MSLPCLYVQGKCFGLGMRGISPCEDKSCPGPKGGEFPPKPASPEATGQTDISGAPETREEETMPSPKKPTPMECPECNRPDLILYSCKYHPVKVCPRCSAKFAHRAKVAKATGQQSATKAHDAAKASAPTPSKPAAKTPAPVPPPPAPTLTRADLAGGPTRPTARLVFSLQIPAGTTALELMDLLRSVPSTAVVEG